MNQELLDSLCSIFEQSSRAKLIDSGHTAKEVELIVEAFKIGVEAGHGIGYSTAKSKYLEIINTPEEDEISI